MCVCVRVRGLFLDFELLKGALCAAISLWDSGIGSRAQKQSSLFISWKASEQVSQSESMTNGRGGVGVGGACMAVCTTELRLNGEIFVHTFLHTVHWPHSCLHIAEWHYIPLGAGVAV